MQAFKQGIVEASGTDAGLDTKHNPNAALQTCTMTHKTTVVDLWFSSIQLFHAATLPLRWTEIKKNIMHV